MYTTFATCFYALNSKFPADTYLRWTTHLIENVKEYYLVLFTDEEGEELLTDYFASYYFKNPNIKIVVKPCEKWYNYQYKAHWIKNHKKNILLNHKTEWKVNMLWAEKIHFVNDARTNQYFQPTEFYGWCDIGYFREGPCPSFAISHKILELKKNKIYYACVTTEQEMQRLQENIERKNEHGLPIIPIPPDQVSIAGGFFITHHSKIEGWGKIFDAKLSLYFEHNYLVKDDQMIILDCIMSDPKRFEIIRENAAAGKNPWFQFRRFLG